MYRTLPYLGLFAAVALLQVFLFDNLTISIYLNPLVYIVFIALLPLDTPPAAVLGAGLALASRWTSPWARRGSTRSPRC